MSLRRTHLLVIVWTALFLLIGFGVWEFQAGQLMLIGYLACSALVYAVYALYRRCPWCRMPVLLKPIRCLGIEFYLWTLTAPRSCWHCGKPLVIEKDGEQGKHERSEETYRRR